MAALTLLALPIIDEIHDVLIELCRIFAIVEMADLVHDKHPRARVLYRDDLELIQPALQHG